MLNHRTTERHDYYNISTCSSMVYTLRMMGPSLPCWICWQTRILLAGITWKDDYAMPHSRDSIRFQHSPSSANTHSIRCSPCRHWFMEGIGPAVVALAPGVIHLSCWTRFWAFVDTFSKALLTASNCTLHREIVIEGAQVHLQTQGNSPTQMQQVAMQNPFTRIADIASHISS